MRAAVRVGAPALAAVAALVLAAPAAAGAGEVRVARRKVVAGDGTALALYRYGPGGGGGGRPAVLLVPDLGFGRECFDLDGEGLARYLSARGRDAFVAELRGQGAADGPSGGVLETCQRSQAPGSHQPGAHSQDGGDPPWARPFCGTFLTGWAAVDLPAAVEAVQAAHPGPVDLVVHGYGGALALMAAPRELKGRVRRVVALSPAVAPEVPNAAVEALLSSGGALSRTALDSRHEMLFTRDGIFSAGRLAALRKSPPRDLGAAAAAELLAWMRSGELALNGVPGRERLGELEVPVLVFLPILDNYAHSEFASPLRELAPKARVQLRTLSKLYLHREDYSHLSMLHGKGAAVDVFAPALRFLDAPEPAAAGEAAR